jgi:hypothetical protein
MARFRAAPVAPHRLTRWPALRVFARPQERAADQIEPAARPSVAPAAPLARPRPRPRAPEAGRHRAERPRPRAPDRSPTSASPARSRAPLWTRAGRADRSDPRALAQARAQPGAPADQLSQPFLKASVSPGSSRQREHEGVGRAAPETRTLDRPLRQWHLALRTVVVGVARLRRLRARPICLYSESGLKPGGPRTISGRHCWRP